MSTSSEDQSLNGDRSSQSSRKGLLSPLDDVKFNRGERGIEPKISPLRSTCVRVLVALLIIFIVIALAACSAFVYVKFQLDAARKVSSWQDKCLPCSVIVATFSNDPAALGYFDVREDSGVEYCCGGSIDGLTQSLKSVIGRNIEEQKSKGEFCRPEHLLKDRTVVPEGKPAAHCVQDPSAPRTANPVGIKQTVRSWRGRGGGAFLGKDITYSNGHLTVPQKGFYYVYSQIYFTHQDTTNPKPRRDYDYTKELSHYINRANKVLGNSDEVLLKNLHSKCTNRDNMHFWEHTSYLGAVVYLRQHDEVYVQVSNLTLVEQSPKISYFGLYMI